MLREDLRLTTVSCFHFAHLSSLHCAAETLSMNTVARSTTAPNSSADNRCVTLGVSCAATGLRQKKTFDAHPYTPYMSFSSNTTRRDENIFTSCRSTETRYVIAAAPCMLLRWSHPYLTDCPPHRCADSGCYTERRSVALHQPQLRSQR